MKVIKDEEIEKIILDFIHEETGYCYPKQPHSHFEELTIEDMITAKDQTRSFRFRYHFDEDGFSMYEKTHLLVGWISLDSDNNIVSWELEEIDTSVFANLDPYGRKEWKKE